MRLALCLAALPFIAACASRTVQLAPPDAAGPVPVEDLRITKDVTMRIAGSTEAWVMPVNPPLAASLRGWLAQEKPQGLAKVEIEQLALANDVGFGTADKQDCAIESAVRRQDGKTAKVRTAVKDDTSTATAHAAAVSVVLTKCLQQHARDIARAGA